MSFNWFDILLALVIAVSAVAGLRSGFMRVVIGLAATIAGLLLGFWCYRIVAVKVQPWVTSEALADVIGFLVIFIGLGLMGSLIAALFAKFFRWIGLSWFDHLLGAGAGFLRGLLVVAALAAVLVAFVPSPTPAFLTNSRVMPYATQAAAALAQTAPRDLREAFEQQWQNLKAGWEKRQQHKVDEQRHTRLSAA